ncbi:TlpA family protein disulfide reductase [Pseudocolwellia agarivorans]|uniref:TlpA family protein disulfide reductase n=1 Tax=Pseudocolwellia agarivorans TaxID=1911682 RepID=UPI000986AB21|nr:redoxin domain-containing protein [Pseudocolwellia agarivorans]
MSKILNIIICGIAFCSYSVLANVAPFNGDVFNRIKNKNLGKQWLMVLWSVDCPACYKELALIKSLRKENPNIDVIIVNTDGDDEANAESYQVMEKYQLLDITTYFFEEGTADRNRYVIDPTWYGELPRSYFVDTKGTFHGKSGLVEPALLRKWLL